MNDVTRGAVESHVRRADRTSTPRGVAGIYSQAAWQEMELAQTELDRAEGPDAHWAAVFVARAQTHATMALTFATLAAHLELGAS